MKESEEHPVQGTFKQNMAFRTELKTMEFNKASTESFCNLYREVEILLFILKCMERHVPTMYFNSMWNHSTMKIM